MKGNWIPWAKGLIYKPEILRIGTLLGISIYEAASRCMLVWEWADSQTSDGFVHGVTPDHLDSIAGLTRFGATMLEVKWLKPVDGGLTFPGWCEYNSKSTKARIQARERKRLQRERDRHAAES